MMGADYNPRKISDHDLEALRWPPQASTFRKP